MQHQLETNPFRSSPLDQASDSRPQVGIDFVPILHRWERYRIWYNALLIIHTLLWTTLITPRLFQESLFWFHLCCLGAVCNLCFFAGPAFEAYGRYFGMWSNFLSGTLFLLGLMFTGVLDTIFLIVRAQ